MRVRLPAVKEQTVFVERAEAVASAVQAMASECEQIVTLGSALMNEIFGAS
jgi:hypothetical protein